MENNAVTPGPARLSLGSAEGLALAAAPVFAAMALLTAALGGPLDRLCSSAPGASWLTGMVPMYLLMSAFHLVPWLKLIAPHLSLTPSGRRRHFVPRRTTDERM